LAHDIAKAVAEYATQVGNERVGRTRKLPLQEKAMLAVRATFDITIPNMRINYLTLDFH